MSSNMMTIQVTQQELTILSVLLAEELRRIQKLTDHAVSHGDVGYVNPHARYINNILKRNALFPGGGGYV